MPSAAGSVRQRMLDDQFLHALQAAPASAADWFLALAARVPGDAYARFMSDTSGAIDEARIVGALVRPGFLAAGAARVLRLA